MTQRSAVRSGLAIFGEGRPQRKAPQSTVGKVTLVDVLIFLFGLIVPVNAEESGVFIKTDRCGRADDHLMRSHIDRLRASVFNAHFDGNEEI